MNKNIKKHIKNQLGFTLVEVMIASAILGTLSLAVMQLTGQMTKDEKALTQRYSLGDIRNMSMYAMKSGPACKKTFGNGTATASVPYVSLPAPVGIYKDATQTLFTVGTVFGSDTKGQLKIIGLEHGGYQTGANPSVNIQITVKTGIADDTANPIFYANETVAPFRKKNVMVTRFPVNVVVAGGIITDCYEDKNAFTQAACDHLWGTVAGSLCVNLNIGGTGYDTAQMLKVNGNSVVTGNSLTSGTSTLTGAVAAGSTLAVTGASTLTGAVSAGSTLAVTGTSTLTGAVTAANGITVTGSGLTLTNVGGNNIIVQGSGASGNITAGGAIWINAPAYSYSPVDDSKAATVAYVKNQIARTLAPDLGTATTIINDILSSSPSSAAFSITSQTICVRTRINGNIGAWGGTYCDHNITPPCGLTAGTRCGTTYYVTNLDATGSITVAGNIQASGTINSNVGVCIGGICATTFDRRDCGAGWAVRGINRGGVFCTRTYP